MDRSGIRRLRMELPARWTAGSSSHNCSAKGHPADILARGAPWMIVGEPHLGSLDIDVRQRSETVRLEAAREQGQFLPSAQVANSPGTSTFSTQRRSYRSTIGTGYSANSVRRKTPVAVTRGTSFGEEVSPPGCLRYLTRNLFGRTASSFSNP